MAARPRSRPRPWPRAVAGDPEAAQALARAIPQEAAPELHASVASEALDRAALADRPPEVAPEQGAQAVREAIRFGENPDAAPLPALIPELRPGILDERARAASAEIADPVTAAQVLKDEGSRR